MTGTTTGSEPKYNQTFVTAVTTAITSICGGGLGMYAGYTLLDYRMSAAEKGIERHEVMFDLAESRDTDADKRLTVIESSRYTAEDALAAEKAQAESTLATWQEISRIWQSLESKAGTEDVPSAEVTRWLDRLENRVTTLENRRVNDG